MSIQSPIAPPTGDAREPGSVRLLAILLALCAGLMASGIGIAVPVLARRFAELGAGSGMLGLMSMVFALGQLLAAPAWGAFSDRRGRRLVVTVALAAFTLLNAALVGAGSVAAITALRFLEGVLTAGLWPAAVGAIADRVPEAERAGWIGLLSGGFSSGLILGPAAGGWLYDGFGYSAPYGASAIAGAICLALVLALMPETRAANPTASTKAAGLRHSLRAYGHLLAIGLAVTLALAYVLPEMPFYFFSKLGLSTFHFGAVIGCYGVGAAIGQVALGRTSDRLGRKPVIIAGLALNSTLYLGLCLATSLPVMAGLGVIAGLGMGLLTPALNAALLERAGTRHSAQAIGHIEAAMALGNVLGPLLLVVTSVWLPSRSTFALAGCMVVAMIGWTLLTMREGPRPTSGQEPEQQLGQG